MPIVYKGIELDYGYRLDFVVEETLILEVTAVDQLSTLHEAQLLTYLRLTKGPRMAKSIDLAADASRLASLLLSYVLQYAPPPSARLPVISCSCSPRYNGTMNESSVPAA